jgi:hypothetical protein
LGLAPLFGAQAQVVFESPNDNFACPKQNDSSKWMRQRDKEPKLLVNG